MNIQWKNIDSKDGEVINSWLSEQDKHNLCMEQKNWNQTAQDINDCFKNMHNAEFKNLIGYINNKPVVALMFGVEQIQVLNIYNIVVNPNFRNMGIAKNVVKSLLSKNKSINVTKNYNKVIASALPDNNAIQHMFKSLGFINLGYNGEYVEFEKSITKIDEKVM